MDSLIAILLLVMTFMASQAQASDLSFRTTLTSEYIFRGQQRSNGDPALQAGLDYEHDSGFFGGVWASTVDIPGQTGEREYEADFYAGFHHQFRAPLSTTVTLMRYTYPGQTGLFSYDYNELLLSATWRDHYSLEFGYTDDLNGHGVNSHHWELQFDYPVANAWVLGATLGRNDLSNAGVSRYYYWDVGASARYSRVIVDLRWFDNERLDGYLANASAGSRWVVSLSMAF